MIICVDFDGTIVDHRYPDIGPPAPGALECMKDLAANGAKLILFTMRSGETLDQAVAYLAENGVTLYGVNTNPNQKHWTESPKVYGQVYIDDAAFGCPVTAVPGFHRPCVDWSIVREQLLPSG
jgi:hydroxymethylpyrimidine pyrophosphatase-like HAD family hydrolase